MTMREEEQDAHGNSQSPDKVGIGAWFSPNLHANLRALMQEDVMHAGGLFHGL